MKQWSKEELNKFADNDSIEIEPFYDDGKTHNTPITIWFVVIDNNLYIRAHSGLNSKWYQSSIKQKAGKITAAGKNYNVNFTAVRNIKELDDQISQAYKNKYAGQSPLEAMIATIPTKATLLITPRD
ncbi:DUF2255 family protein [Lactobacillus acetotolerans]|nr:DUF2255 family protein [Lactobacillus acetotolerans]QGV05385.1 DUF2255 family protein [Lactobacillus acetotolerans]